MIQQNKMSNLEIKYNRETGKNALTDSGNWATLGYTSWLESKLIEAWGKERDLIKTKDKEERIANLLTEVKDNTTQSKFWKGMEKASEVAGVLQDTILGPAFQAKELFETFSSVLEPSPTDINTNINKVKSLINTTPSIQESVGKIKKINESLENINIQEINDWSDELDITLSDFKKNLLIRDILANFLLDLRVFISGLTDKLFLSTNWNYQDVLNRITEILYENNDETIEIINNKLLPPISSIDYSSDEVKSLCFTFKFDDCLEDHIFTIVQPTLEKKIVDILFSTLKSDAEGKLVYIGPLIGTTEQIESGNYTMHLDQLTLYEFALLYIQLVKVDSEHINNLITAFNYNTSGDTPVFDKCNLCSL